MMEVVSKQRPKIVAIVGPTASGKTALSIALAKKFAGEIISADSRQVYRKLDLSSGKVSVSERAGVPHHLLDVVDLDTTYTAHDFKRDGEQALTDIFSRQRLPIIVGGTFMYLDTLLGRISLPPAPLDTKLRQKLENLDKESLQQQLKKLDPQRFATIDKDNPRRLIRAIEIASTLGTVPPKKDLPAKYEVYTIGLTLPSAELQERIHARIIARLQAGMVAEIQELLTTEITHSRLESLGLECRYLSRYLEGKLTYDEMVAELTLKTRQFAKRQLTWLKRDTTIHWFSPTDTEKIFSTVSNFLKD